MKYFFSLYHKQLTKNGIASDEEAPLQINFYDFF